LEPGSYDYKQMLETSMAQSLTYSNVSNRGREKLIRHLFFSAFTMLGSTTNRPKRAQAAKLHLSSRCNPLGIYMPENFELCSVPLFKDSKRYLVI
jgi:hypothetical protein